MTSDAAFFVLGILPIISTAPTLDDGVLWVLGEGNSSYEASVALLVGSQVAYLSFSCTKTEDGVYRDPSSCSLYYRCSHGHREVYKCLDGYLFNAETGRCEEQFSVTCLEATSEPCKRRGDGTYANYSSNCQDYYRCEDHALTSSYSCGPGFSFSMVTQGCMASSEVTCIEAHCAFTGNGFYIIPGTGCRAYYNCDQGIHTDYLCPLATTYDRNKQLSSISGGRSSIHNLRMRHAMVTGTHFSQHLLLILLAITTYRSLRNP